ncbi:amino acid ABC transporter substrate-binding protein [Pollutimonas sp. M17]|uniref:amino acid ABC transporter substrate-binding protein n=1 Tax=Pollutimonas sp. M17 TaxID=2962065 RepID=UPI0021F43622|nr:amino acid ABC transporter substrate-binding protein [Pollutimonas sp. M17]UYO95270.1 amino acid ABC transporter substrate-binding protein [Pollutimonas sp. M17]HWK71472.1 amino acid ABC transporter substrate-binding protein [Burkholderiaceae bacterium]
MTSSHYLSAAALGIALAATGGIAHAGKTFDSVKAKDQLVCGVNTSAPGFSGVDSKGQWAGLDVDVCRAVAAAVLGDAGKVKYVPLNPPQRFTALQSGEIDMLARNTTWSMTRDVSLGVVFTGINYYDGQGFMVPKKFNVSSAKQLKNAEICLQSGTTSEKNVADYFSANGIPYKSVVFDSPEAAHTAFFAGRCQVISTDMSELAGIRTQSPKPDDYAILPDVISKEPLGPAVRRGDDEWFAVVKWALFAMQNAEEMGITQANVDKVKSESKDPNVQRLLGTSEDMGKQLGLDKDWAYRIIKQVGNYGESFDRNMGENSPLKLPRGVNNLWNNGGLMYAPPVR